MQKDAMDKYLAALKTAGINNWEAITDLNTHMYNNDAQFNILDGETLYNFSPSIGPSSPYPSGNVIVRTGHISDFHEVRFGGTLEEVKRFIEAYGFNLTADQTKILVNIKGANYNLKPATGDYLRFPELSEDDLAKLSPEQIAQYKADKKDWEKQHTFRRAAQITI